MSHMVIYRTADGQPGYHQADELDEAVRFVERLRNGDGVDGARIFRMEEVSFDFRPYFKVEIGPGETPVAPAFAGRDHGFAAELGSGLDTAPAAPAYEAPAPFGGEAWAEPEAPIEVAADLGLEAEPVPSFVAPASVTDPSVIDALPSATDGRVRPPGPGRGRRPGRLRRRRPPPRPLRPVKGTRRAAFTPSCWTNRLCPAESCAAERSSDVDRQLRRSRRC